MLCANFFRIVNCLQGLVQNVIKMNSYKYHVWPRDTTIECTQTHVYVCMWRWQQTGSKNTRNFRLSNDNLKISAHFAFVFVFFWLVCLHEKIGFIVGKAMALMMIPCEADDDCNTTIQQIKLFGRIFVVASHVIFLFRSGHSVYNTRDMCDGCAMLRILLLLLLLAAYCTLLFEMFLRWLVQVALKIRSWYNNEIVFSCMAAKLHSLKTCPNL